VAAIRPLDLHQFGWYAVAMGVVWVVGCVSSRRAGASLG